MALKWKIIAIGAMIGLITMVLLFATLITSGALVTSTTVSASGLIVTPPALNLGIYSDSACTQKLSSISWGTISPGSSTTKTIYIKNAGTTSITLSMTTNNWNPTTASGPVTITWDKQSTVLAANQVATATLTLSVSSSVNGLTNFSVDIVISGTG
jgi:hypothetical protein